MTCSWYVDVLERFCSKPAKWRPANIPMATDEWFCRTHAIVIAHREGTYGIYQDGKPVEEFQSP